LTTRIEGVKIISTKEERQLDELFQRALSRNIISKEEFAKLTEGELLDKIYKKMENIRPETTTDSKEVGYSDVPGRISDNNIRPETTTDSKEVGYLKYMTTTCFNLLITIAKHPDQNNKTLAELSTVHIDSVRRMIQKINSITEAPMIKGRKEGREVLYMITDIGLKFIEKYGGEINESNSCRVQDPE
jgi:DNA-binding MarR family transcriptional regulator